MQHPGQNVNWERVCARPPINPTIVTYEILGALQQSRTCQKYSRSHEHISRNDAGSAPTAIAKILLQARERLNFRMMDCHYSQLIQKIQTLWTIQEMST